MPLLADPEPGMCILIAEGQHDPHDAHLVVDVALLDKQIHALEQARETGLPADTQVMEGVLNMLADIYRHLSGG